MLAAADPHQWFLVHTKTSAEPVARDHLERQGYQAYYPRLVRRMRHHGKRVRQICSLFPRYLFVNLRLGTQDLGPVKSTKGVSGIVRFGEQYAAVPDRVIDRLKGREDPHTGLHHLGERRLRPHQSIRITAGPFFGVEGVFLADCGSDRVRVLLSVLGQATPVEICEAFVEPQGRAAA
jgi:transcriptional antiterminator RfaH